MSATRTFPMPAVSFDLTPSELLIVRSFPFHFHSRGSFHSVLRFSEVSRAAVTLREKPRTTLIHRVVAPTGPAPRSQFPIELEARLPLAA
jgi:hypothetical protein